MIWADRRFKLGYGRVVALYVMAYTAGRGWIEYIRVDDVQLDDVYGLRFNVWMSIVLFLAAAAYFVWSARKHPGREEEVYRRSRARRATGPTRPMRRKRRTMRTTSAPRTPRTKPPRTPHRIGDFGRPRSRLTASRPVTRW